MHVFTHTHTHAQLQASISAFKKKPPGVWKSHYSQFTFLVVVATEA